MQGSLIWGAFTAGLAAFCVWRPQPARIFVGLFFGAMGLGIHGALIATNPQSHVDFAANAPWAIYRDAGTWLTEPNPLVGITPLGLEEIPNLVLAAGMAFLITQQFPTDVWTMLRRHRWIPEQASWVRDTDFPGVILMAVVGGSSVIAAAGRVKRSCATSPNDRGNSASPRPPAARKA